MEIFPFLIRIIPDAHGLPFMVRIDKRHCKCILLHINALEIAETKRPIECRTSYRPPEVDELPTMAQGLGDLGGRKVCMHTGDRRGSGLVNMHVCDGLALPRSGVNIAWAAAADSWEPLMWLSEDVEMRGKTYCDQKVRLCSLQLAL